MAAVALDLNVSNRYKQTAFVMMGLQEEYEEMQKAKEYEMRKVRSTLAHTTLGGFIDYHKTKLGECSKLTRKCLYALWLQSKITSTERLDVVYD